MEVIFLLGSVQAAFLAILLFNKKNKGTSDYVLGAWLVFMGLNLLYYYLFSVGFLFLHPHLLGTGMGFSLLEGPFIFIYVVIMISTHGKFRWVYLLHALPFLAFTIFFTFEFYLLSAAQKLEYYEILYTEMPRDLYLITLPMLFSGPIYLIWSLIKLRSHAARISQTFSYKEQISLDWLRNVLIFVGFVWFVVILANIFVQFPFLSTEMHMHLQYLAMTIAVFFLGYFGIKQQAIYRPESLQDFPKTKPSPKEHSSGKSRYVRSGLKKPDASRYAEALKKYFENERPYLQAKLTLHEVADYLQLSSNHLSQVINEDLGMSFFDFVNSHRVEEAKSRLLDPEYSSLTFLAIAYDCGFNSKSSFNNIFKKHTGDTPSQYKKRQ